MTPALAIGFFMSTDDTLRLIYLGLLLASIGGWIVVEYRNRMGQALRTALAWLMIFVGAMAGYGLWGDIRNDILPQQSASAGQITVPLAEDGHYHPNLVIDGTDITFIADTGASSVVLTPSDARKLGINPDALAFIGQAMTANGTVRTARVTLHNVTFGPFFDETMAAEVNQQDMASSLLGMEYLGRFKIELSGNRMKVSR